MNANPASAKPAVPGPIVVNFRGHTITATREHLKGALEGRFPWPTAYWIVTVDGDRYMGWPPDPKETEDSVTALLQHWIDANRAVVRQRPGA